MRTTYSLLSVPVLLSTLANGNSLFCNHIRAQGKSFDLEKLGGPHSVQSIDTSQAPVLQNTTWTVDICNTLKKSDDLPSQEQCQSGTNVCGIKTIWNPETDPDKEKVALEVIAVAGSLTNTGSALEPYYQRLNKTDDSPGGLRIEMHGGKLGNRKQQAIIDFLCDKDRTGNERDEADSQTVKRAAEGDEEKKSANSLSFVSYEEDLDKKLGTLRLTWKTKYVCEEFEDDDEGVDAKAGWGFFTWFILILFMGVAAYLIFGSWLNYNRYGARGWDLLPHGDTIRDVPYIFKDFSRKVFDTFSGSGSRGGYSAV